MKTINYLLYSILFVIGCQKEPSINEPQAASYPLKKLENPYSLEVMQKAYLQVARSSEDSTFILEPTHYYVKFKPQNIDEYELLCADSTIELFHFPLDVEFDESLINYHDPEVPDDQPTYQYTAVPIDYSFPTNVDYDILDECYIPEDTTGEGDRNDDFLAQLEYQAYKLTNNLDDDENNVNRWGLPSKQYPKGHIRVKNTVKGVVGVRKVKVRIHRFVKYSYKYTNSSGYYKSDKWFRYKPHYTVIFQNQRGFKVWGNPAFANPATFYAGWKSKYGYSRTFYKSDTHYWKFASVNNAVDRYFYHCWNLGITYPPSNLKIWVVNLNSGYMGSAPMLKRTYGYYGFTTNSQVATFFLKANALTIGANVIVNLLQFVLPDIIFHFNTSIESDKLYEFVFHECAHASHWSRVGSAYWVKYINYIITYGAYGDGTGQNAGYCGVGEMWGNYIGALLVRSEYYNYAPYSGTTMASNWGDWFVKGQNWFNPGFLKDVDNISGINIPTLNSCLTPSTNTNAKMKQQIKNKTTYDTQVENAWNNYSDWQ